MKIQLFKEKFLLFKSPEHQKPRIESKEAEAGRPKTSAELDNLGKNYERTIESKLSRLDEMAEPIKEDNPEISDKIKNVRDLGDNVLAGFENGIGEADIKRYQEFKDAYKVALNSIIARREELGIGKIKQKDTAPVIDSAMEKVSAAIEGAEETGPGDQEMVAENNFDKVKVEFKKLKGLRNQLASGFDDIKSKMQDRELMTAQINKDGRKLRNIGTKINSGAEVSDEEVQAAVKDAQKTAKEAEELIARLERIRKSEFLVRNQSNQGSES